METQIQEPPGRAPIAEGEAKPVEYIMNLIGPEGAKKRETALFTQVKRLGGGLIGNVYLAETTYTPSGVTLPKEVAIKVSNEGKEATSRAGVNMLIKIRNAIKGPRIGMIAFPAVYAVDDQPGIRPYSYAMEVVNPEQYGGIYTAMGNVNSLITMLTVYSDAVDIMIEAGIAQNDRKTTDIVWFENGQKLSPRFVPEVGF